MSAQWDVYVRAQLPRMPYNFGGASGVWVWKLLSGPNPALFTQVQGQLLSPGGPLDDLTFYFHYLDFLSFLLLLVHLGSWEKVVV